MNISKAQLATLSSALSDITRGFKKLKKFVDSVAEGLPDSPKSANLEPTFQNLEIAAGTQPQKQGVLGSHATQKINARNILNDTFEEFNEAYLFQPRCKWNAKFLTKYVSDAFDNRIRCNSMNMCWVLLGADSHDKKSWQKISVSRAQQIYDRLIKRLEELLEWLEENENSTIRASKWCRRKEILKITAPEKLFGRGGFKQLLLNTHDDLPSLK